MRAVVICFMTGILATGCVNMLNCSRLRALTGVAVICNTRGSTSGGLVPHAVGGHAVECTHGLKHHVDLVLGGLRIQTLDHHPVVFVGQVQVRQGGHDGGAWNAVCLGKIQPRGEEN